MKKYIFNNLILLLCIFIFNTTNITAQTQVSRYTPQGSTVRAYNQITEMSSGDKARWSAQMLISYPSATELNPPSATRSYNCHSYAWHVSQGGDNVWIGYYAGQEGDEDIYWTDGSYIQLNTEAGAEKISYYQDNHSAIQTSTQGTYKSKWGEGPLMQHSRDYGPSIYYMNYRNYYANPVISGNSSVCYPGTLSYSVQDFYNVTYTWTTSSNLQINGSNTARTVSISPKSTGHGSGYVRVSIYIPSYGKTRVITKNIQVGLRASFTGPSSVKYLKSGTWTGSASCGTTPYTYDWYLRKTGTGMGAVLVGSENPITLQSVKAGAAKLSTEKIAGPIINQPEESTIFYIYLKVFDANGNYYTTAEQQIYAYGIVDLEPRLRYMMESSENAETSASVESEYMEVFPNPATDNLTVKIVTNNDDPENDNFEITLFDKYMNKLKSVKSKEKESSLNVSDLKNDVYIIKVNFNDKQWTEKIIIE